MPTKLCFGSADVVGFSGLTINSTGFAGIDLLHVTKVVALMGKFSVVTPLANIGLTSAGATYDEQLSAKTTVMVCQSSEPNVQKLKFATDKRIPAVNASWLWDCVSRGVVQPYEAYQLNRSEPQHPHEPKPQSRASIDGSVGLPRDKKQQSRPHVPQVGKATAKPQRLQKPRALNLALSAEASPESNNDPLSGPDTSINSFAVEHDEHAIGGFDGHASMPLQDVDVNSPRRPSVDSLNLKSMSRQRSSSAESLIRPAQIQRADKTEKQSPLDSNKSASAAEVAAAPAPQPPKEAYEEKDYSDMLAQMRANRKAAPDPAEKVDGKRRRRQLGRATSTRSNQSTGELSSGNIGLEDDNENTVVIEEYQPSQQLGWDAPGAAKAREQMIKKLGGTLKEKSVPVQGIGIVKDVGGESTTRASRRRG